MWSCVLKSAEESAQAQGQTRQCNYVLKHSAYPDLHFLCETKMSETLDFVSARPVSKNGETIPLNYIQLQNEINQLTKKILKDFELRSFTLNSGPDNTVSVVCKVNKRLKVPLSEQIVEQPLSPTPQPKSFLPKLFKRLSKFLDLMIPEIEKYMLYLGLKAPKKTLNLRNSFQGNVEQNSEQKKVPQKLLKKNLKAQELQNNMIKLVHDILTSGKSQLCFSEWKKSMVNYGYIDSECIEDQFGDQTGELAEEISQVIDTVNLQKTGIDSDSLPNTNSIEILPVEKDKILPLERKTIIGGVSTVDKVRVKLMMMKGKKKGDKIQLHPVYGKNLALKQIRKDQSTMDQSKISANEFRFRREKEIIKYINKKGGKKNYLLNYYYDENPDIYYVEWAEMNLAQYLHYNRQFLTFNTILNICSQIVYIVQDLHECGVVHRDLKPSNFVVMERAGKPYIKLIDFSDSMIIESGGMEVKEGGNKLYSTISYSPLECSRTSKEHLDKGLDKKQIDFWSVGIIICEILNGYMPISYSSSLYKDIHTLWPSEFLTIGDFRNKKGIDFIREMIQILKLGLIQTSQNERMLLQKALFLLLGCRIYLRKLNIICFSE